MVQIPAGTFLMGSTEEEERAELRDSDLGDAVREEWFLAATPPHEQRVVSLLVDKFPVTVRQFQAFTESTGYRSEAETSKCGWRWDIRTQKWKRSAGWNWRCPDGGAMGFAADPDHPVVQVSWTDAVEYCAWAGKRLLTEAEWEYACRAGTRTRYYWGDDAGYRDIDRYAWYIGNADNGTHPVGRKKPNPWGLHDMSGNVWEWVAGAYAAYPGNRRKKGSLRADRRVMRGGAWYFHPTYLRSAYRGSAIKGYFVGFRCAVDDPGSVGVD